MNATPFLCLPVRGKKDALRARHKARQVAQLLRFEPHDQACIAAGVFVVACQGLGTPGGAQVCFQIDHQHLRVFVQDAPSTCSRPCRSSPAAGESEGSPRFCLAKPLPREQVLADRDVAWLLDNIEKNTSGGLFEELIKQNQEILTLLHELRVSQGNLEQGGPQPPSSSAA